MIPQYSLPLLHLRYPLWQCSDTAVDASDLVPSGLRQQEYLCHMLFKTLLYFKSGIFQAFQSEIYLQCFHPFSCAPVPSREAWVSF